MQRSIIFSLLLFLSCSLYSQEQAIKLTKQNSDKEIIIKENKRVKIKTMDGRKITGRLKIENNTIIIDEERFQLEDIAEMKRNPLLLSILTSSFFIYAGAITIGLGGLIGVLADSTAFWLIIPGAGLVYAGIKSPNFNRKFKNDGSWSFEIITLKR
ncbi:hypothetical protein [Winogradskyella vincentii]|uniref:Positive regulator of sigma(E), RseC/MucC n=1 Tax=Winogradskyella vincentii TaxID=2877122 RepID=A0ABS7Y3R5_9FLAO|nr:hypothetical protein [Winogradskyella vincentii]MCA0153492.1 hypothetical protein [Winogradskyella vincentii]